MFCQINVQKTYLSNKNIMGQVDDNS